MTVWSIWYWKEWYKERSTGEPRSQFTCYVKKQIMHTMLTGKATSTCREQNRTFGLPQSNLLEDGTKRDQHQINTHRSLFIHKCCSKLRFWFIGLVHILLKEDWFSSSPFFCKEDQNLFLSNYSVSSDDVAHPSAQRFGGRPWLWHLHSSTARVTYLFHAYFR